MGKQTYTFIFLLFLTGNLIAQSGNVGIGTSNPLEKLHLSGGNLLLDRGTTTSGLTRSITLGGARFASGGDYGSILFQNLDSNSGNADYIGARISSQNTNGTDDGDLRFSTYNGTLLERMVILSNGRVGIGNSSPTSLFSVGDDLNAPSLGGTRISVSDSENVSGLNVGEDGNNRGWLLWDNADNSIHIGTRSNGIQYNDVLRIKERNVHINTNNSRTALTIGGPDSGFNGPVITLLGNDSDQFESGRIRFLEGIAQSNLRGGYIHLDGQNNLFHIGVHIATGNEIADELNAISIDRGNARVGINNESPSQRLDVGGNIRASGEYRKSSTSTADVTPLCYGTIDYIFSFPPAIKSGTSNFTVTRESTGIYQISINGYCYNDDSTTASVTVRGNPAFASYNDANCNLEIRTYNIIAGVAALADNDFSFIVFRE